MFYGCLRITYEEYGTLSFAYSALHVLLDQAGFLCYPHFMDSDPLDLRIFKEVQISPIIADLSTSACGLSIFALYILKLLYLNAYIFLGNEALIQSDHTYL